jgi:hypothetical protein
MDNNSGDSSTSEGRPSDRERELERRELEASSVEFEMAEVLREMNRLERLGNVDACRLLRERAYALKEKRDRILYREAFEGPGETD